ncbi:MAG: 3-phosphoshikimate 1-carboxyvinyltransferase [Clostridia bacterium]
MSEKGMRILPAKLQGDLTLMPSKSLAHRAILCAALAEGTSTLAPVQLSEDVAATLDGVRALGMADVQLRTPQLIVHGGGKGAGARVVQCRASGSTLRFLLPLALDGCGPVQFVGTNRLLERPLTPYRDAFVAQGVRWEQTATSLTVEGVLHPGIYRMPGDLSSQFMTGLLLALPRLGGVSRIVCMGEVESRGYIDLTLDILRRFGVHASWMEQGVLQMDGHQTYTPAGVELEGDWSHAAFYLAAGAIGGSIRMHGLATDSLQGDRAMAELVQHMGAHVELVPGGILSTGMVARGIEADLSQTPDIVPALAVAACAAQGETRLVGASRLRLKECDRIEAMCEGINRLGGSATALPDGLSIKGIGHLYGGMVDSYHDHRIAMALTMAASICTGPVRLAGADSVRKSAPTFWQEYRMLGGMASECILG